MDRREMKCPHCKQWTEWKGMLQDRCSYCNELLELEKINRLAELEAQRKIDEEIEQQRLDLQNPLVRKLKGYAATIFIGFILTTTSVVVLFAG